MNNFNIGDEPDPSLEEKQKHLKQVYENMLKKCAHDRCPDCHGTGIKLNGDKCVHWISCSCPKCTPPCQ